MLVKVGEVTVAEPGGGGPPAATADTGDGPDRCESCPVRKLALDILNRPNPSDEEIAGLSLTTTRNACWDSPGLAQLAMRETWDHALDNYFVTRHNYCKGPRVESFLKISIFGRVLNFGRRVLRCQNDQIGKLDRLTMVGKP